MNIKAVTFSVCLAVVTLAGCTYQNVPVAGSGSTGIPAAGVGGAGGAYGSGYGGNYGSGSGSTNYGPGNGHYTPADLHNPNSILAQRIIYFDYDRSEIKPEFISVLNAHASLLAAYPNLHVRLEGHADERGSREYNVALSERRGYSVQDYLGVKDVRSNQMEVIGYGEEIPAVFGHNEAAWSKNRRVEIKYPGE